MNKPASLRAALEVAIAELKKNPERMLVFIDEGQIVSTQAPSLCFEYHYKLNIIIIDYTKHSDTIFVPMLAWIYDNQPDILTGQAQDKFSFEAEIISQKQSDISIKLSLTERVIVTKEGGNYIAHHPDEPKLHDVSGVNPWALYSNGNLVTITPLES